MPMHKKFPAALLAASLALGLAACGQTGQTPAAPLPDDAPPQAQASAAPALEYTLLEAQDLFAERDLAPGYDALTATITLGETIDISGSGAALSGRTVTITGEGVYRLVSAPSAASSLTEAQILVDAPKNAQVQLLLDGVHLCTDEGAVIRAKSAGKLWITLAEDSSNTLAGGQAVTLDGQEVDGALFSQCGLTLGGSGSLRLSSPASGIVCKEDLILAGGDLTIEAGDHAIDAEGSVRAADGSYTFTAGSDGIHASHDDAGKGFIYLSGGSFAITCGSDGLDASGQLQLSGASLTVAAGDDGLHSDADLIVEAGSVEVTESEEGLEGLRVILLGGTVSVSSRDDGINATSGDDEAPPAEPAILIAGGVVTVAASGDGVDCNGSLEITGGELYACIDSNDNGALDYDTTATISGGIVFALDPGGMSSGFTGGCQASLSADFEGNAGETLALLDENGAVLASCAPAMDYRHVVVSCPGMAVGESVTLQSGETSSTLELTSTHTGAAGRMGRPSGGFEHPDDRQAPPERPEGAERPEGKGGRPGSKS